MTQPSWHLDAQSDVPLHRQFAQRLRQEISQGVWGPGDRILSERDLMALAGVSRATVRQAISELAVEGLLERVQGAGTFIRPPRLEQALGRAYSFAHQVQQAGFTLHDTLLRFERIPADRLLAERLQIPVSAPVVAIVRLRRLGDTPMILSEAYLPEACCPGLLAQPLTGSLYALLNQRYGLTVARASERIEALVPDRATAEALQLPSRVAVMLVDRTAYTQDGRVLHWGLNTIRGDMCYFRLDASGDSGLTFRLSDVT